MSLFIAWMPRGDTLARLGALRDTQRAADATRRWTSWRHDAQLHMTLRFLTDDTQAQPAGVCDALGAIAASHAPMTLVFDRIEAWPHVLVACGDASPTLRALFEALDRAAVSAGLSAQHGQTPHVTLAYARRAARTAPDDATVAVTPPIEVTIGDIHVVRTAPGAYAPVARHPLRG